MTETQKQIDESTDDMIKSIGKILLEIGENSSEARELIEQDLLLQEMSIKKCYDAIYEYAKKHRSGNSFGCAVLSIDPNNTIIKIILDFYKIPKEWLSQNPPVKEVAVPKVSLFDLL